MDKRSLYKHEDVNSKLQIPCKKLDLANNYTSVNWNLKSKYPVKGLELSKIRCKATLSLLSFYGQITDKNSLRNDGTVSV